MAGRRVVKVAAAVAVLASATWIPSINRSGAAGPAPGIAFVAAAPQVAAWHVPGEAPIVDLGLLVVAHQRTLEVRSHRSVLGGGWSTRLRIRDLHGKLKRSVAIPTSSLTSLGFKNAVSVTIGGAGGPVLSNKLSWCPGGRGLVAVDADAAPSATFPDTCSRHPFAFGLVSGLDPGWGSRAGASSLVLPSTIPDGTYTATATLSATLAGYLQIPTKARRLQVSVVVSTLSTPLAAAAPTVGDPTLASTRLVHPLAAAPVATPDPATLPDLGALPAYHAWMRSVDGHDLLTFSATEWNKGPGPMVIEGYRVPDTETMDASQIFYKDGQPVSSIPIGQFVYHHASGHNHWHFIDFTAYDLTDTKKNVVATSGKQSWCLAPTDPIDLTVPNAVWRPEVTGLASACGDLDSQWLSEVMPVGWGDTYTQWVAGQAIEVTDVPNGRYYIRVTVNPAGHLYESDTTNNVSLRLIVLGGTPGHRTVSVPAYKGIVTG